MSRLRPLVAASVLSAAVITTTAHAQAAADPDRNTTGGLAVPGWTAHFDRPAATAAQVHFAPMAGGMHVTSGPAAIYFDPSTTLSGDYAVAATFTQTKAPTHPEAYGLFVGGERVASDSASYLYFIVRGDGKYAIKHRANATDVHSMVGWTDAPALVKADAAGKATNALRVTVAADSVRFFANGKPVAALARQATGPLAGVAGFRVNHNLDVHVADFTPTHR